jgi:hypothetical protein
MAHFLKQPNSGWVAAAFAVLSLCVSANAFAYLSNSISANIAICEIDTAAVGTSPAAFGFDCRPSATAPTNKTHGPKM